MDGTFALESVARKGDVESPIFHSDGLKEFVGVGVPNLAFVGNLINAAIPGNIAPCGHTRHCSFVGVAKKRYTPWIQCRYHQLASNR
jgi:hypothetical protein